jgi:hypothetical protein
MCFKREKCLTVTKSGLYKTVLSANSVEFQKASPSQQRRAPAETGPAPEAQPEEGPAAPAEEIPEADAVSENEGE